MIQIFLNIITKVLTTKLENATCFSFIADETVNISIISICPLLLWVVAINKIHKTHILGRFLCFIEIKDNSAENWTEVILQHHAELHLACLNASHRCMRVLSVTSYVSGVYSRIHQRYPKIRYVYCTSHWLNFADYKTCWFLQPKTALELLMTSAKLK